MTSLVVITSCSVKWDSKLWSLGLQASDREYSEALITILIIISFLSVEEPSTVKAKIHKQKEENIPKLSVLLFEIDSLAQNIGRKLLKNTYNYLLQEQHGILLSRFHKVGENTFPNMIPYMTGVKCQRYFPTLRLCCLATNQTFTGQSVSEKFPNKTALEESYFDELPILWKNFSQNSFITGYSEDRNNTTFNYNKKGYMTLVRRW